ncbi:glycine cleavage T C-terminal barrel domain-containing protein [Psychromonas sp. KJ10-2]|uniref:glycine cleavage T C-terminal barrel domain-containing protein n=1 Tax=Psychromonas sp. KJ10-2 TaxID=3391822 RepID=UPI0039B3EC11
MNSVGIASGGGAGMNLAKLIVEGRTEYDLGEADAKRFAPIFNSVEHLMARAPEILGTHYDIAYPGKQLKTARNLRKLPLDSEYREAKAHMGQFYGWERPLYFNKACEPELRFERPDWHENVRDEVMAAHTLAAIFDASPFGKIEIEGPDAEAFMRHVCAGQMGRAPGSVIYSALLNDRGTFESDVTAQRISDEHYRLFVGTNAIKRDLTWLQRHSDDFKVTLTDSTEKYAVLGLMGPRAAEFASKCGAEGLNEIAYFKHAEAKLAGKKVRAARMSYVGEAGWEITCDIADVKEIYAALTAQGAQPAGMFAQSSMRIEKGFCAMGHELDGDVTPITTGLDFATRKAGGFIGAEALAKSRAAGDTCHIVSLAFDDESAVPLGHEPIYFKGKIVGQTSSCAFGFRIGKPVALGHSEVTLNNGDRIQVDIARTLHDATVTIGPLFDPTSSRMKV